MAETKRSSTGGTVTYPSPGVIRHVASTGNYSGKLAGKEAKKK